MTTSAIIKINQSPKHEAIAIWAAADGRPSYMGTAICEALKDVVHYPVNNGANLSMIRRERPQYRFVVDGELPIVLTHRLMIEWDRNITEKFADMDEITFNPAVGNFRMIAGKAVENTRADVIYSIELRETEVAGLAGPKNRASHRGPGVVLVPSRPWITMNWKGSPTLFEGWAEQWLELPESKDE